MLPDSPRKEYSFAVGLLGEEGWCTDLAVGNSRHLNRVRLRS